MSTPIPPPRPKDATQEAKDKAIAAALKRMGDVKPERRR